MLRVPNRANARIGRKGQPLFSTLLSSVASFANTITITGEPDAGTLTSATAGDTYSELLALVNEGTATTDGPGGVTITPTLTGSSSNPVEEDDVITGFSVVYTATDAAPVVRIVTFDPVITVPAPVPAPVITGLPTISGVERVGELLTATPASVTNGGTLTWQWFADGVAISGATSSTFLLTLAQEGTAITVQQTQTNDTGSATATSTATGTIVHVAPTASNALADQSFTIGTGVQTYAAAGDFTGEELSYSLNTITGVTVNAATGVVSFDTDTMALQASTSIIITATNTGGSVQSGFGVSITAVAFAFTDNTDGTLDVTTEGTQPAPIIVNNGDGTATTDEAGAYIYKPSANAEDDFTGAVGSSTLSTATGAGTFKVYKRVASSQVVTAAPAVTPVSLGTYFQYTDPVNRDGTPTLDDMTSSIALGTAATNRHFYFTSGIFTAENTRNDFTVNGLLAIRLASQDDGANGQYSNLDYIQSDTLGGSVTTGQIGFKENRFESAFGGWAATGANGHIVYSDFGNPPSSSIETFADGAIVAGGYGQNCGVHTWNGATEQYEEDIRVDDYFSLAQNTAPSDATGVSLFVSGATGGVAQTIASIMPDEGTVKVQIHHRQYASNFSGGGGIANTNADDTVTTDVGPAKVGRRIYVGLTGRFGSTSEPTLTIDGSAATAVSNANKATAVGVKVFYIDSDTIGGSINIVSKGYTDRREVAYQIYSVENVGVVTESAVTSLSGNVATTDIDVSQHGAVIAFSQHYDRVAAPTWVGAVAQPSRETGNFSGASDSAVGMFMDAEVGRTVSTVVTGGSSETALNVISIAPA